MISITTHTTAEAYQAFGKASRELTQETLRGIHSDLGDTLPERQKEMLKSWENFKLLSKQGVFTVEGTNYGAQHVLMVEQFAKGAGIPLSDALLIQAEAEAGCQTMFIQDKNSIYAIHTEEDVDDHAVTALNRRRDPTKPIPTDEKGWNKFSNNTPYNYRNVHIKTADGHERTFFAYAGIATGGPAFGVNQETDTLIASDILFTEPDVDVKKGIWPNAICALYQDVGDIRKARILTQQINTAIQNRQLDGITGGYALHMAQAGKKPAMATFEFGNKTITEMPPKEVVHINAKTGEREIRYVTSRPNLPKNPELAGVDALNSEALLMRLNRRFPAVERRLRSLLERTSLASYNSAHRELAAKLLKNDTIPLFDKEALQAIDFGFPNLVEEAKHASKAFWGHLKMATWQVEMDRRQRRLDKNGAFIQFPGKGEGNYAILDALWRITTTRHGDIDPTTNSWRQKPESDRAGLANPWDVAVMTAYIDSTGVHGEVHKLTPQNTRETVRRVLDDRNDSAEYVPETITGTQVLIGTGSARRELETIAGCRSLQDMAVTRIGTGKFAKDRTILNESTVETGAIDTETWQNIKEKIISLKNAQSRDHAFTPEELEKHFTDSDNAVALIKYKNEIIGYSYAMPTTQAYSENDPVFSGRVKDSTTAYLYNVVIDPRYQGRGLVGKLSSALEDKLREKGYTHLEMDAAIQNGYANSIQKAYGARVIVSHDHPSIYGEQRYFLLDIQRQPSQDKISYVIPKSQSQGDKTHAFTFAHANESQAWGEMPSLHRGANIQLGEHLYRITYMRDGTMTAQRMDPKTNTKINDAPKNLSYVRDQETGSVVVTMIDTKEANRKHLALQLQQAANRQSGLDTQFSRN